MKSASCFRVCNGSSVLAALLLIEFAMSVVSSVNWTTNKKVVNAYDTKIIANKK